MIKPHFIIRSAFIAAFLFAAVITLHAGAPIRGVDVKLGRNPGGNAAARTTTDDSGHFSFPAQPDGSYTITIASSEPATVTVHGAAGGTIRKSSSATSSSARTAAASLKVDLKSDGKTPLTGIVETAVVRSRSNVKNN